MHEVAPILAAAAGGMLPALAWLWFWLREDAEHPEPRKLIALAFLGGMISVAIVIPIEQYVATLLPNTTITFAVWSVIEEVTKFLAALATVLWRREDDEPIDAVVYMVTVALGFAAVENTLFLMSPLSGGTPLQIFLTGNLRFVGATLLHVLSSAAIGIVLAFSFYRPRIEKIFYAIAGVILAVLLHASFNFFILNTPEADILRTFGFVWLGLVMLLAALEYVKRIRPRHAQ